MPMVLTLTAISGSQISKKLAISGRVTTIGSATNSNVVLMDRQIELRHAEIHQLLDRFFLVPLTARSTGISLNGMPVQGRSRLNPGDIVTLGGTSYRVSVAEEIEQAVGSTSSNHNVPRLGEYFIRRGLMSREQVDRTGQRQAELQRNGSRIAFGQVAYDLGYINRSQLDAALADQRNDFNDRFRD